MGNQAEPRVVVVYRTAGQRMIAWAVTILAIVALFASARLIGSFLMELLAFVLACIFIVAFEALRRKGATLSIAEARARLDQIEREGR